MSSALPSSPKFVLLTVPHGYCPSEDKFDRACDRLASTAAISLGKALMAQAQDDYLRVDILSAHTPRALGDYNRIETAQTSFHASLGQFLPHTNFVVDVHSFPTASTFGQTLDLYFLVNPSASASLRTQTAELARSVATAAPSARIGVYPGSPGVNYITERAIQAGKPTILVEFHEELNGTQLQMLTTALATALLRVINL